MATLQDHIDAIDLYLAGGCEPGSCTNAILENDLFGACSHADLTSRYLLFDIVQYLYNRAPFDSWGTPERVRAWKERKRAELLALTEEKEGV
jgi:hypothetical protein